jgi:hypothetical protein
MAGLPWDDAAKYFAKYVSKEVKKVGKSQSKKVKSPIKKKMTKFNPTRGDYLVSTRTVRESVQGSRKPANMPASSIKPKSTSPKRKVKTQSPTAVKSVGEGVDAAKNMKTTKVLKTPPKPKRTYLKTKDREITLSPTEQREAERQATRMIRRTGDKPVRNPQPTSGQKPVGRRAPSTQDASKRTRGMDKNKGNNDRGFFEADKAGAEASADKKKFGKGQKLPKKKNVPPKKGAKPIIVGGKFKPVRGDKLKSTSSVRNAVDDWLVHPSSKVKPKSTKPAKKAPTKTAPARKKPAKPAPATRYQTDIGSQLKSFKAAIDNAKTPQALAKAKQDRINFMKKRGLGS